jgi:FixJ family two-component response regulator
VGLQTNLHGSVPEFLKESRLDGRPVPARALGREHSDPIIFITGYGDIPMSVGAIKGGAIEFLTKPFRDQDLLDAIQQGLDRDRAWRACVSSLCPSAFITPPIFCPDTNPS